MSLAKNIIEIATEYAKKNKISKITEIEIEVGKLSGVVIEALEFALNSQVSHTSFEEVEIKIVYITGLGKCLNCGLTFPIESFHSQCPDCKEFNLEIVQGKEFKVKSISGE